MRPAPRRAAAVLTPLLIAGIAMGVTLVGTEAAFVVENSGTVATATAGGPPIIVTDPDGNPLQDFGWTISGFHPGQQLESPQFKLQNMTEQDITVAPAASVNYASTAGHPKAHFASGLQVILIKGGEGTIHERDVLGVLKGATADTATGPLAMVAKGTANPAEITIPAGGSLPFQLVWELPSTADNTADYQNTPQPVTITLAFPEA